MKKINLYLIYLICFGLPGYLIRFDILGIPTTALEILLYIVALITIVNLIVNKKSTNISKFFKKYWIFITAIVLFFISGIVAIVVSPVKMVALGQFKALIFDPILFFFIILANNENEKSIGNVLYSFSLSGIYVGSFSLYQYLLGNFTDDHRIVGIFGYTPNYTAFYLVPLAIIASYDLFINFNKRNKIYSVLEIISIIVSLIAIYLSGSRAAILALIGALVIGYAIKYLYITQIRWYWKSIIASIIIICSLAVGWQYTKPNFSLSPEEGGRITASNNIRFEIWNTTVKNILFENDKWLFGVGLGNYQDYFTNLTNDWVNYAVWISPKALTAHNLWLSTWVSLGILGLIAFFAITIIMIKNINLKNQISFSILLAIIAILIQGMVDTPYWKNDLSLMWWLFAAIIILLTFFINHEKNARKS